MQANHNPAVTERTLSGSVHGSKPSDDLDWRTRFTPAQLAQFEESGLDEEIVRERGYECMTDPRSLLSLGFSTTQCQLPGLLIPLYAPGMSGVEPASYVFRPDHPVGKHKYLFRPGDRQVLDVPPRCMGQIGDPSVPLFVVEGAKKGDALATHDRCVLVLGGVWNWRGTNAFGGKTAIGSWEAVALNGRLVNIAFDSDTWRKPQIHRALERLTAFLHTRGALVRWIVLPDAEDGTKVGADDFLRSHTIAELEALSHEPSADLFTGRRTPWTSGPADELLTSLGLAQRFARECFGQARYVPVLKQWIIWDGARWRIDDSNAVTRLMIKVIKGVYREGESESDRERGKALIGWALRNETNYHIEQAVALASKLAPMQIDGAELDAQPNLLTCLNGTIDLETGALLPHDPEDLITKRVPVAYDPDATCPQWEAFVWEIMGGGVDGDDEVRERVDYLQRVLGYAISGETVEQVWFYLFGRGRNGKSTLLEIIAEILGPDDYSLKVPVEMILQAKGGERHPTDEADVPGRRFVFTSEMPKGRHIDVARVKDITGGDQRATRHMRQDYFRYTPVCTLFAYGNSLPEVRGGDLGFWERLRLIIFNQQFLGGDSGRPRDKYLKTKLRHEREGILVWLVRGCLAWRERGLQEPTRFALEAADYRAGMDPLDDFFATWCEEGPGFSVPFATLFENYQRWATLAGERYPLSSRRFGNELSERGYPRSPGTGRRAMRLGLRLRDRQQTELERRTDQYEAWESD